VKYGLLDQNRIEPLDWLRGLMAVSIMFYHLAANFYVQPNADSFIGRLGIYAVSVFFILSGLSLAHVYHASVNDIKSYLFFMIKRIFRIWPLLWIALVLVMLQGI